MVPYRRRPEWQVLLYQQGVGLLVALKLLDDLFGQRSGVYSGELFPWAQMHDVLGRLPASTYWVLLGLKLLLLVAYFARRKTRLAATGLTALMLLDTLVGYANHRLLLTIMMALVALKPVPRERGPTDQRVYWNMELQGWQISLVYFCTAIHKCNPQFLSGETLRNLFAYVESAGFRDYPDWLSSTLQDPTACLTLAVTTIVAELFLAVGLHVRATVGWAIAVAVCMHLGFSLLMPRVELFTLAMLLVQITFLPTRIVPGAPYRLLHGSDGPPRFARLAWRGTLELVTTDRTGWAIEGPDGGPVEGYAAWLELVGLSPWTFVVAEVLRIPPLRWIGRKVAG